MTSLSYLPHRPIPASDSGWVDAAPFRALLPWLIAESGLPWRVVAIAIGLPTGVAKSLVAKRGCTMVKRIRAYDGATLTNVTGEQLQVMARSHVPASQTSARVQALLAAGYSPDRLSDALEVPACLLTQLAAGEWSWCLAEVEWRVLAGCEAAGIDVNVAAAA